MCPAKYMGKNNGKIKSKSLNSKYSKKLLDHAKQAATVVLKTSSKRIIQKTVETTADLIRNKIADKITRVYKSSPKHNSETIEEILREKYISPQLRQKLINDLKLKEENC